MGTSRPSVHTLCCMHLYTLPLPENASLRIDERSICFDQDILYGKKDHKFYNVRKETLQGGHEEAHKHNKS